MTKDNDNHDDEIIPNGLIVNTWSPIWEQLITKMSESSICTSLQLINEYDQLHDTTALLAEENEDEKIWELETRTDFIFGWICQC